MLCCWQGVFAASRVPVVSKVHINVQINVPREVSKQMAIQDPDYEMIEEQTIMVQEQVPNPNYREPGTGRRCDIACPSRRM
jgi:hypothetical protein